MSLVFTGWGKPNAGTVDTSWRASDDPTHSRLEAVQFDDSITLLHPAATNERATFTHFDDPGLPVGKDPVLIDVKWEPFYGPVASGGGGS